MQLQPSCFVLRVPSFSHSPHMNQSYTTFAFLNYEDVMEAKPDRYGIYYEDNKNMSCVNVSAKTLYCIFHPGSNINPLMSLPGEIKWKYHLFCYLLISLFFFIRPLLFPFVSVRLWNRFIKTGDLHKCFVFILCGWTIHTHSFLSIDFICNCNA